ncbi:MAG: sulfatase-like hydrolase/transferase, partial [Bacteroidota bacterium]
MRWAIILMLLVLYSCQREEAPSTPPNIIFIMADDHAEKAISAYGYDLLQTPYIDRLATEGILFENSFVTNSICAPSRAVLLTGKYSHLNGLRDNRDRFDGDQLTFPKLLQQGGYKTAMVGKWHLKTTPQGFDYWNVLIGQGDYYNPRMVAMGDTTTHIGYTTDLITDFALDYLENRDSTKPFCMMFHHKAPHRNWMPHPRHFGLLDGRDIAIPDNFYDDYSGRATPAAAQDMHIDAMF